MHVVEQLTARNTAILTAIEEQIGAMPPGQFHPLGAGILITEPPLKAPLGVDVGIAQAHVLCATLPNRARIMQAQLARSCSRQPPPRGWKPSRVALSGRPQQLKQSRQHSGCVCVAGGSTWHQTKINTMTTSLPQNLMSRCHMQGEHDESGRDGADITLDPEAEKQVHTGSGIRMAMSVVLLVTTSS